jgi:hypothetical protein
MGRPVPCWPRSDVQQKDAWQPLGLVGTLESQEVLGVAEVVWRKLNYGVYQMTLS